MITMESVGRITVKENISSISVGTVTNQSSSSLADKLASCDDLLKEILLRLPVRSLLRFLSVSKHWYLLITSPSFRLLRNPTPGPPSGLFVPVQTNKPQLECEFVPFDIENSVKPPFTTPNFGPHVKRICIEHSSNGLMLCSNRSVDLIGENMFVYTNEYYIYNPTINQFTSLPRLENYDKSDRCGMTIAFDPSTSPHYRIIYVCGFGTDCFTHETRYQIEVYSSQTRTCKPPYELSLHEDIDMGFRAGVYWNNAIHWINHTGFVLYFNLDDEKIDQILTPFSLLGVDHESYSNYIFETRDHLLVVEIPHPHNSKFKIHELKRDYSGWSVKYLVDLEEVGRSFPEIMNPGSCVTFEFALLSLVLGEIEDDSFLVLEIPKKVVRFNLASKTSRKLHEFTASCRLYAHSINYNAVFRQWPYVFQFVESLYSV